MRRPESKHGPIVNIVAAMTQCADEEWKCKTCAYPAEEEDTYCRSCRSYWDSAGELMSGDADA